MSLKPSKITEWALEDSPAGVSGALNKIEPKDSLKLKGILSGPMSLNSINFILNNLGLWTRFLNEMAVPSDGNGKGLTKDGHFSFILAFDTTNLSNYLMGIANKPTAAAGSVGLISNNILTFGAPNANGDVPISGGVTSSIRAFSLNFKL